MSELEGLSCSWKDSPACNRCHHLPVIKVGTCLSPLTPCHDGASNLKAVLLVAKASCKVVLPQNQLCCWEQGGVFLCVWPLFLRLCRSKPRGEQG